MESPDRQVQDNPHLSSPGIHYQDPVPSFGDSNFGGAGGIKNFIKSLPQ
jgi:hypothetical protein